MEVRAGGEWSPAAQHGVEEDAQRPAVEIAVNFLLGFLNRHLVGPLLELHIHIQRSPASWPSDGVTFLLEVNPVSEALLCNSGFQFRYVPVPQDG